MINNNKKRNFTALLRTQFNVFFMRWRWSERKQQWDLKGLFGKSHATVWPNGVWSTWDKYGTGGENSICQYAEYMAFENRHFSAKREAWESCEKQGFI